MTTLNVHGIAVKSGISRNGIMYTDHELEMFTPTLIGRPILKDHEARTDNTIGKVTNTKFSKGTNENQGIVEYNGWVKEDGTGITEKIIDHRVSEVSIGAIASKIVKESEDSEYVIAKGLTAMELSTTPTPGIVGTSISHNYNETRAVNLARQLIEEEDDANEDYKCKECGKTFSNSKELKKHMMEKHDNKEEKSLSTEDKMSEEIIKNIEQENNMLKEKLRLLEEKKVNDLKTEHKILCEKHGIKYHEINNIEVLQELLETLKLLEFKKENESVTKGRTSVKTEESLSEGYVLYDKQTSEYGINEFFMMPEKSLKGIYNMKNGGKDNGL